MNFNLEIMSKIIEELQHKFSNIQTNIELKQYSIKDSFKREIEALKEKYNEQHLLEKYSKEMNLYKDELSKQISINLKSEIGQVINMGTKQIKKFEFKSGLVKSAKICINQLIKKEFKFNKIFPPSKLIKYKKYFGLDKVILADNHSNHESILLEAMFLASKIGHFETVKCLVENGADVNAKDEYGDTALIIASEQGYLEIVKKLVENGADMNERNLYGRTAFISASHNGHFEIVKYLDENGADVEAKDNSNNSYNTALIKATLLMNASANGQIEMVKYFVQKGADVNAKDQHGWTALTLASGKGHFEIVKYLVENGADVNSKDKRNETALIISSKNDHFEIVKYLIENGADANDNSNKRKRLVEIEPETKKKTFLILKNKDSNDRFLIYEKPFEGKFQTVYFGTDKLNNNKLRYYFS